MTSLHEAEAPEPSATVEFGFETDNLSAFKERLPALGIADAPTQTMGWGNAVALRDPDGNRVIVYEFRRT